MLAQTPPPLPPRYIKGSTCSPPPSPCFLKILSARVLRGYPYSVRTPHNKQAHPLHSGKGWGNFMECGFEREENAIFLCRDTCVAGIPDFISSADGFSIDPWPRLYYDMQTSSSSWL
ncbi:hypothetical protein CDAR_250061 [Caerostris darwini]|uniref:Uncharacterized protein n=1 Tax=Caerostris darwini TaxID=1538125 RepID=A0AAV4R138_9ARAC|nr:hypothetical protein CDAR_250061 [Caerostris darwini]